MREFLSNCNKFCSCLCKDIEKNYKEYNGNITIKDLAEFAKSFIFNLKFLHSKNFTLKGKIKNSIRKMMTKEVS